MRFQQYPPPGLSSLPLARRCICKVMIFASRCDKPSTVPAQLLSNDRPNSVRLSASSHPSQLGGGVGVNSVKPTHGSRA